jgi:Tfp pilus assembly protein PilX
MIYMKKINDEKGIVSILVSIVMMIVLTLLVLGLAQIGISDQKNALKRQLSTEAYYLAESGINNAINNNFTGNCSGGIVIDSASNASIPCVIASTAGTLKTSLYQLNNGQSKVVTVSGTESIARINFTWTGNSPISADQCTNTKLTTVSNWNCPYPLLMINIVSSDLLSGGVTSGLFKEGISNGKGIATIYLYPSTTESANTDLDSANKILRAKCSTSCSINVNIPNGLASKYYLRITPIYASTAITLSAYSSAGVQYNSNQAYVDSTGKVGNTSQRLYTRITTDSNIANLPNQGLIDQTPLFGIQTTQDLCKNFQGYYNSATDSVINTASQSGPSTQQGTQQAC